MQHTSGEYRHDVELRARLQAFSPDEPGVVFPFSARLAREAGWTSGYTARVVEEYRRFVYLAMTAGHPVSPSARVDEVWHLHLTYTRSYWDEMCGRVLGRPLHHEPTTGGGDEGAKFVDWYARTRESYRRAFGEDPPRDIWPVPVDPAAPTPPAPKPARPADWEPDPSRPIRGLPIAVATVVVLLFFAACAGGEPSPGLIVGGFAAVLTVALIAIVASNSSATTAGPRAQARRAARGKRAVHAHQARNSSCSGGVVWAADPTWSAGVDDSRQNSIDCDRGSDTTFSSSSNDSCDAGRGDSGGGDSGGSSCGSSCGGGE